MSECQCEHSETVCPIHPRFKHDGARGADVSYARWQRETFFHRGGKHGDRVQTQKALACKRIAKIKRRLGI